jgi:hypothetical protein
MSDISWKSKLACFEKPKGCLHEVDGEMIEFLPVSTGSLLGLRGVIEPIAQTLSVLFDSRQADQGSVQRTIAPDSNGENGGEEIIIEATSDKTLEMRLSVKQKSIANMMAVLTNPTNTEALGELILDSLRKHFGSEKGQLGIAPPAKEFMTQIPATTLVAMAMGVAKANKGVFGPLGLQMGGITDQIRETILAKVSDQVNETNETEKEEKNTETPVQKNTTPTPPFNQPPKEQDGSNS